MQVCMILYILQSLTDRSSSLVVSGVVMQCSFASEVSPSPFPSHLAEHPHQYQLPTSPGTGHVTVDLHESPESSSSNSSSKQDISSSPDSASVTTTDMSMQSSSSVLSQPNVITS